MTAAVAVPARPAAIGQDDRKEVERLVGSMLGTGTAPKIGLSMHLRLFAASLLDGIPTAPRGRILIQEALSLECWNALLPGEEVEVAGERQSTDETHVFRLAATTPSAPEEPAAALTARLRLVDPELLSGQAVREARHAEDPLLAANISADHLSDYSAVSGDTNPIHTDRALAQSYGLGERVVHGTLLLFLVESALSASGIDGDAGKIQMRFFGPAFAGQTLRFAVKAGASSKGEGSRARVYATRPDGVVCVAADARLRR